MERILGLEEVLFFVENVQEAKVWMMKLFEKDPYFDREGYCAFHLGTVTVGLHPSDSKTASGAARQVAYWRRQSLGLPNEGSIWQCVGAN